MEYTVRSIEETKKIAEDIVSGLHGGDILLLHGDLGAGKTTLTKLIANELGITNDITSPTFSLMNMYSLPEFKNSIEQLVHIDTYRLEHEQELIDIGIEDYLGDSKTLTIIEWPDKIQSLLKNRKAKHLYLEHIDEKTRVIKI